MRGLRRGVADTQEKARLDFFDHTRLTFGERESLFHHSFLLGGGSLSGVEGLLSKTREFP
jgi:hypothetical protein